MIAARLQQTLTKRIEMIESLLLIYSYSELVTIKVAQYQKQNEKMHQKQLTLIEAYKNLFRIDQKFRKQFYTLIYKSLNKLNSKYKSSLSKNLVGKIHGIYFELLSFFKIARELEIVRCLSKIQVEQASENELFYILIVTLIKYLKSKTDVIILKLREKNKKESLDFYEDNAIKKIQSQQKNQQRRIKIPRRGRINMVGNRKLQNTSIPLRKYHSQEIASQKPKSQRKYSNSKKSTFQHQRSCLETNTQTNKVDLRVGCKKFQQIYSLQWRNYYTLLSPLKEQLEQISFSPKKIENKQRRRWISDNFQSLYKQTLSRNQQQIKSITSIRSSKAKSPQKHVHRQSAI